MNIPNFENIQFTTQEGFLTAGWLMVLMQLFTELQNRVGQRGFVVSPLTNAIITDPVFEAQAENGTIVYNVTTDKPMIRLNDGTFHVIQTL